MSQLERAVYAKNAINCVISGFRCDVEEICAFLDYYAAMSGSFFPDVSGKRSVQN